MNHLAAAFQKQAERCFRLADSIMDPEAVSRLRQMGRCYEDAARRAEPDSKSNRMVTEVDGSGDDGWPRAKV